MQRHTPHATRYMTDKFSGLGFQVLGFVVALLLPTAYCLQPRAAQALSVNPAIFDVAVDPGKTEVSEITIVNDEAAAGTYAVTIQKFIPSGASGQQQFLDPSDTSGLPEWMYVGRPELTLAPGQTVSFPVTIRVPEEAKSGGYYAALFLSKKQGAGEQVATLPRLGILFFVRVNGPVMEKIVLRDFSVDANGTYESLPVGFRVRLANEGDVHLSPEGTIVIKNMLGLTVAKLRVNTGSGKILPQSERVLSSIWSKGETMNSAGFWNGLVREVSNFAVGQYTATLEFSGRGFQDRVVKSVSFAVWPWRIGIVLVGLLVCLVVAFSLIRKIAVKSAIAKIK